MRGFEMMSGEQQHHLWSQVDPPRRRLHFCHSRRIRVWLWRGFVLGGECCGTESEDGAQRGKRSNTAPEDRITRQKRGDFHTGSIEKKVSWRQSCLNGLQA